MSLLHKTAVLLIFTLMAFDVQSQNVPLTEAKVGDYVIISGKRFTIRKDDGELWHWKRIQSYFYVDQASYNPDGSLSSVHLTGSYVKFNIYFDQEEEEDNNYEFLQYDASIMVCDTCDPKGSYVRYICNDSLNLWSTHPSRPFYYGYALTKEKCEPYKKAIDFMEIKPGDKIASVGAASGWYESILSVITDDVEYTIEDVDTVLLNKREFRKMTFYYDSIRERPQTNFLQFVIGTYTSTELIEKFYDKIIIRNAYHEFTQKWKMLHDIKSKLNPETGKIILLDESFSSLYYTNYHAGCNIRSSQVKDVMRFFNQQGLYLEKMHYPINALGNDLIFGLDKKKSENYFQSLEKANEIIKKVDRLNTSHYAMNEEYVEEVEIALKENLNLLHTTYDSLQYYLSDIGSNWTETENYQYAINVLELSDHLYPNIAYTYFYLGIAYYGIEDRQMGDEHFAKCIALDASRKKDIEAFKKDWIAWWGE